MGIQGVMADPEVSLLTKNVKGCHRMSKGVKSIKKRHEYLEVSKRNQEVPYRVSRSVTGFPGFHQVLWGVPYE